MAPTPPGTQDLQPDPADEPSVLEEEDHPSYSLPPYCVPSYSQWYLHTRRYIRKIRDTDRVSGQGKNIKQIPPHHRPFTPYVEKSTQPASETLYWSKQRNINICTIRHWLHTCKEVHGSLCGDTTYAGDNFQNGPALLIDANDRCLVTAPTGVKYISLSYVWGNCAASACTTKATLPLYKEKDGLTKDANTLPLVINQALDLVRSVGERYLWVDRFCIVQDEDLPKLRQLNAMGEIYANGYFTLISGQNSDATEGLYGRRLVSPKDKDRAASKWDGANPQQLMLQQAYSLMRTTWHSRGWTMQEYLLSRRRVIFHNDTVNWECLCSSWNEIHYLGDKVEQRQSQPRAQTLLPDSGFAFDVTPWPNMFRYARLVSLYNRRNLTYPEDVLYAFIGILTHLSRSFPGGFIAGLPRMCFDAALLWQPWTHMTRRISIKGGSEAQPSSWSWAGWSGSMNSESWRSASNYMLESDDEVNMDQQCSWETFSTVEWSYSRSREQATHMIRVPVEFSHPRFDVESIELPSGWSKAPELNHHGHRLYYHSCAPSQPFRYPIPIRDQYKAHIPPVAALYLHGMTQRGFLKIGPTYKSTASSCPAVDLLTKEGAWAGALRLNCTSSDLDSYIAGIHGEADGLVELIEISTGEVHNQPIEEKSFDEWNHSECPRHQGLYEFVNVLWIKWESGIAHREALGRVKKEVWSELENERTLVILR